VELSDPQLVIIRQALRDYHYFGSGVPGVKKPWPNILSAICELTDLVVEIDGSAEDKQLKEANQKRVYVAAENIRKFAMGVPERVSDNEQTSKYLPYIIEFLTHESVRKLTPEVLARADISLEPARHLSEYLWDRAPKKGEEVNGLNGSYYAYRLYDKREVILHLSVKKLAHPFFFAASETAYCKRNLEVFQHKEGWGVYGPDLNVIVFLKDLELSDNIHYEGSLDARPDYYQIFSKVTAISKRDDTYATSAKAFILLGAPANEEFKYNFARTSAENYSENIILFQGVVDFSAILETCRGMMKRTEDAARANGERSKRNGEGKSGLFAGKSTPGKEWISVNTLPSDDKNIQLIDAIKSADFEQFVYLLRNGADVNFQEPKTLLTPLHRIALLGRRDELKCIIKVEGLRYTARDAKGRLPSQLALSHGSKPAITRFLAMKEYNEGVAQGFMPTLLGDIPFTPDPF